MKKEKQKFLTIDKNFKLQIILSASALMHLTFMVMFSVMQAYLMMVFNVFSVVLYIAGAVDCIRETVEKHKHFWIIATFSEIVLHSIFCTVILGLETFFVLYLMLTIPVAGYSLFFYVDRAQFKKITRIFSIVTSAALVFCVVFGNIWGSLYEIFDIPNLTTSGMCAVRSVNIAFSAATLFGFTFLFYTEIISLIEELNESNRKFEYIATHDELTGLSNRHSLWKYFDGLIKSGDHYCIVMGDIDDFKKINDTYGHECGDRVLKSVACIILNNTENSEMACRWGGEEMLLIMRGEKAECISRVEQIRRQICSLDIKDNGRSVKSSMTFGVADCDEPETRLSENEPSQNSHVNMDRMISLADKKLYIGKNSGKNVIIS